MSEATGEWLRRERDRRGWDRAEMARRLISAGHAQGDKHMPAVEHVSHNIFRWEHGAGVSHRYVLYYCAAYGIDIIEFPLQDRSRSRRKTAGVVPLRGPHIPAPATMIYRGDQAPDPGGFTVEHEVMMAAHESSDHAAEHEQRGIGEATFEQLRADVMRLSRLTDAGSPLTAFLDTRRVRDRIYRLLDRQPRPADQADLYFLLGCAHALMGMNANRLGYPDAAEELIRAGWAYANTIGHNPLRGKLRATLASINYWRGRFREASDMAADGLRYVSEGPLGADLRLNYARAAARLGDPDAARQAVGLAHDAREGDYADDLTEIGGGQFAQPLPMTYCMAGGALAEIPGAGSEAAAELERSISLYDQDPDPGEEHWFGGKALAGTHLAVVRLRSGALDAATAALEPVFTLRPVQRTSELTTRLERVRDELVAPVFQGSPQARDLGDQIEEFGREAVTAGLHTLSG